MKNLIKNVIRSFTRNKISIIGLIFLLFFGLGVFCVMSNTTNNITNEYTSLANQGRLHDFTAAELYEVGSASYAVKTKGITYTIDTEHTTQEWAVADFEQNPVATKNLSVSTDVPTEDGIYYYTVPEQQIISPTATEGYTIIRTYSVCLDGNTSTGLYKYFAESKSTDPRYINFDLRITRHYASQIEFPAYVDLLNTALQHWPSVTTTELRQLAISGIFADDYDLFLKQINDQTQTIYNIMTTTNTKLSLYLDDKFSNEVEHRLFKSINITGTKDNIFYKIIDSNPTDTIDKMVLFADKNGRTGNHLFDANDWAPYDSKIEFFDKQGKRLEPGSEVITDTSDKLFVPKDFNDVVETTMLYQRRLGEWNDNARYVYSQIMQIRFKRMLAGDITDPDAKACFKILAGLDLTRGQYNATFYDQTSVMYDTYQNTYMYYWHDAYAESIALSANGNVVFSWVVLGAPQTCTISNWTSKISIVNPQHLEKNNKYVLDPSQMNDFAPFREWHKAIYGSYPSGEINQSRAIGWFNSLDWNQFSFWINPNSKSTWTQMEYSIPGWDEPLIVGRGTKTGQWNGIADKYIASCGGFNEIIWGCGLTPDFMYPVVDISRPTPNTKTECLVYCNEVGYNSIKLAFVTSTVEEYLLARFKANVNTARRHEIVNAVNAWAKEEMIFPEGTRSAYFANDTSNVLNCSGFRVAYIPNLVNVITIVSNILCSFIGILCLIICFVIIKRYVEGNRVNIGIMRANGIKKWKIAVSLLPFALLPAIVGGVGAYITGLLLQAPALGLFSNYWMLPTPLIQFDWVSFLACIFVPFILFSIICVITTMIVLRVKAVELMKVGSEFKTNAFSRVVKKPFKYFGIMTRFRVSLAFNSITRLLMLAAMSCLTMSSLVFAFTTFDKLNRSRATNSSQFKYSFNIELTTPTSSGSVYSTYDYYKNSEVKGFGFSDPENYLFNTSWNTTTYTAGTEEPEWLTQDGVNYFKQLTKWYSDDVLSGAIFGRPYQDAVGLNGNIVLPSIGDQTGQNTDLFYLQNKMLSKLSLDHVIGVGPIASNPWEIALALMPANSRNIAADSFNSMMNAVGHEVKEATDNWLNACIRHGVPELLVDMESKTVNDIAELYWDEIHAAARECGKWINLDQDLLGNYYNYYRSFLLYDKDSDTYSLNNDITVIGQLFMGFNSTFVKFVRTIYNDINLMQMEYPITYGAIPLNWGIANEEEAKLDETYTYLNGLMYRHNISSNIKVEGIKKDSQYIHLTDKKGREINDRLFDTNYLNYMNVNENEYPIIVNAYAAHKYGFKVGETIDLYVSNTVDRYIRKLHPELFKENDNLFKFKIVGISRGTNNEAYYTSQDVANNILGLPNGQSWNKTHRYMPWSENSSSITKLVDLAGVESTDQNNISLYSFNTEEPTRLDGSPKLKLPIPVGFNGIYTQNKEGKPITAGLALYSYTGMYPGTSVYNSLGNNKFEEILTAGANLAIANFLCGGFSTVSEEGRNYYQACANWIRPGTRTPEEEAHYRQTYIQPFISDIVGLYGDTTMITGIIGAMDVAASDLVYSNLISTFDLAETTIMAIVIPITIIIVAVISNLIINDSKKMAAMLKALGYSDSKNLMSILALFVPTIVVGLALAIPLSLGLTLGYQAIIFNSANILVDVTQKWWYYVAAVGGIGVILIGTYAIGFVSLKKDRLVDQIK